MTNTPPEGLKQVLLVDFYEPDTVLVKDGVEEPDYKILKSELWPYPSPVEGEDNNWHYTIQMKISPQIAGTFPKAAYEYTKYRADQEDSYTTRCIQGEKIIYLPDDEARGPGHIYSQEGLAEFRISRCCEYHFDKWFEERPDTDSYILALRAHEEQMPDCSDPDCEFHHPTDDQLIAMKEAEELMKAGVEDTDGGDPREP